MTSDRYAALIFTRNRLADLMRCVASVRAQTVPASEIIVIDNGSTDGTAGWLSDEGIRSYNVAKRHLAHIFNQGWQVTAEPFIMFLADDVEASPSWAAAVLPILSKEDVGAVSGPLTSTTPYSCEMHRLYMEARRNPLLRPILEAYVYFALNGKPLEPCRYFQSGAYSFGQAVDQSFAPLLDVDLLTTSAMMIKRIAIEQAGGFDETYWFNHADGDLFLRMRSRGWRLIFTAGARARHHVRLGPSRAPHIIGRDTAIFHRRHLRPRGLRNLVGAALNVIFLNGYWLYAAAASHDVRQLRGIAGYVGGLFETHASDPDVS